MKKKWTTHIIAVAAFGLFIVLGLACATMTPEEKTAYQAKQEARLTDGKGGIIIIRHAGANDVSYYFLRLNHPGYGTTGSYYNLFKPGDSAKFIVDEDGTYIIRYQGLDAKTISMQVLKSAEDFHHTKDIYVSNDQTFVVTIP